MDTPFVYDRSVCGKNFVGRKDDCTIVANLLAQKENIVIHGPVKTGKKSLLSQALLCRRMASDNFVTADVDLLNVRSAAAFAKSLGESVIRVFATTPSEYASIVGKYLKDTHFVFDSRRYSDCDEVLSLNWDLDENDLAAILAFPYLISADKGMSLIVVLNEFQNVEFFENPFMLYKQFETVMKDMKGRSEPPQCCFVFFGSRSNAIKDIFVRQHRFYRLVENFTPSMIDEMDITSSMDRGFYAGGKVIKKEQAIGICRLLRNNIWYINHFCSICDYLSRGFVADATLTDAMEMMLSIHSPRFIGIMDDLTNFQINLLRAILDGNPKISGSEIIQKYELSSSANVKRIKDALLKKEVVELDEKDNFSIIDPLFEYWLRNKYFGKKF